MGCWLMPPAGDRSKDGHRDRHLFAELRLRRDAFRRAELRVGEDARVVVVLEQAVVDARHAGHEDISSGQVRQILERQAFAVHVDGAGNPWRSGRRYLQAKLAQARAVDLEQLDVDDDLGPGLVDRRNQARRSGDVLGRVLERDRVDRGHARDLPHVDDDAQQIDDFLHIGVAEIQGLDDRLFVLATLGRRVGNDGDRALRADPVEGSRAGGDRRQRVGERHLAQVGVDDLVAEARVEDDVEPGKLRNRPEHVAAAGRAEDERVGKLGVGREVEAWRRKHARALDQRFELGLPVPRDGDLGAELLANVAQRFLDQRVARIQLRRELILAERLFVALGAGERARSEGVLLRRAQFRALERQTRVVVVGVGAKRLRVLDDGEVVVPGGFGSFAGAKSRTGPGRTAAHQGQADPERAQLHARRLALDRSGIGDLRPSGNGERERLIG